MSFEEKQVQEVMDKMVKCLIDNGKLMVVGIGGHGKTTAVMHIVRYIMTLQEFKDGRVQVRIGDSANVWKWAFDSIPFVDITKRASIPEDEPALILDLGFSETKMNSTIIENLVRGDYIIQREEINKNKGKLLGYKIYVLEEIQNLLGSYALSGNSGQFWLKIMSEGRNYGQYFIGLGQRFGDVSAKIVERTRYFLLGAISGDNDAKKIKSMFGNEKGQKVVNTLLALGKSQFLWFDKEATEQSFKITFPAFEQNGQPFEYNRKQLLKKITVERAFL